MEFVIRFLDALVPAAWTAAAAAYLMVFVRDDQGALRWAPRLAWTAVAIHLLAIGAVGALGFCPMLDTGSVVSGLGLAVGAVHLVLEGRAGNRAIGVFPAAAVALFALAGAASDPLKRPSTTLPHGTTAIHVTVAVLGYAGLFLAALFGALYLVQQGALKKHRFGLFWERLPSLELLDSFSRRSLAAGAIFLTLTIGFGHLVRRELPPTEGYWDAKVVATNLIWLSAVLVVLGRLFSRLRPAFCAVASVALFGMAMVNMVVVDIFSHVHRGI